MGRKRSFHGWNPNPTGATTATKPIIFWDLGRGRYVIKTPFTESFKNSLLIVCPSAVYLGRDEAAFSVTENDLPKAKVCVEATFGEFDFIEKPEEKQAAISDANGAGKAALTMFTIGGYDAAKRVYSTLIKQYHPDVNPDPSCHEKAAQLTLAWRELKKELGWS